NLVSTSFALPQDTTSIPIWFWIDTLCVPIDQHGATRKLAIARINQTYREASGTLVIDAELCSQRSTHCSSTEIALRISLSRWAQRLWTLQEAIASNVFLVSFADGCINSTELEAALHEYGEASGINDPLLLQAYKWFRDLSKLHKAEDRDERLMKTF